MWHAWERREKCTRFWWESQREGYHLRDQGLDGKMRSEWNEESKIQTMEMKFLRGILGKTRRDKVRNNDIREQLKVDDIKHDMGRNRLKWYGHVMRMADERIPKKMLEMKLRGRRPRGRPRTRWMDQVKRDMKKRVKKWTQVKGNRNGKTRDRWRFPCNTRPKELQTT
jgi:hypothetical protein